MEKIALLPRKLASIFAPESWIAISLSILIYEFIYLILVPVPKESGKAIVLMLISVASFVPAMFSTSQKKNSIKLGLTIGAIIFIAAVTLVY